jgi:GTP pyrophosphokinase
MHRIGLSGLQDGKLDDLAHQYTYQTADDFLAAIGYGEISPHSVIMKLALVTGDDGDELKSIPLIPQVEPTARVLVRGERGVFTTLANCCQPVPGDSIIGYTTRGKGVTVHRSDCPNAVNAVEQHRIVPVDWDAQATHLYPVAIKIEAWDRTGLLRDIATVVAESKVNMSSVKVDVYDDKSAVVSTTVEIDSLSQLSRLMEKLEQVRDVHTVAREADGAAR